MNRSRSLAALLLLGSLNSRGTHLSAMADMASINMPVDPEPKTGMRGMLGASSMQEEGSGTSWQPRSTPHQGIMGMAGPWMTMLHGSVSAVYSHQAGPQGGDAIFSTNNLMAMASRPLGPGTLGFRGMFSLEPSLGPSGYPLLLQSGESADGAHTLVDRQHPHDLFMELATTYAIPVAAGCSVFGYLGLPGEPALGPPAFMHRFSGQDDPVAPISHHWIDSTHVTEGVATLGVIVHAVKLDASAFNGREPDYNHWDIERPRLDSWSGRLSYDPGENLSLEASYGHLTGHDPLAPDQDEDKAVLSAMLGHAFENAYSQTTLAWGRNRHAGETASNACILESAVNVAQKHTAFLRGEWAEKDDLFSDPNPLSGQLYPVGELTLGYIYDLHALGHFQCGLGASGTVNFVPAALAPTYGERPLASLLFLRLKAV